MLTERRWSLVGLLALLAICQVLLADGAVAQPRGFEPVSTLGPVIEPQDLAFESNFANLLSGNPLRHKQPTEKKSPRWVASKEGHDRVRLSPASESQPAKEKSASQRPGRGARKGADSSFHGPGDQSGLNSQRHHGRRPVSAGSPRSVSSRTARPRPVIVPGLARNNKNSRVTSHSTDSQSLPRTKLSPQRKQTHLSSRERQLRPKIRRVLAHYYQRPMNTRDRSPWEVLHAMLAFEVHSQVLQGGPGGEPITAVGWLCFNQPCRQRTLMYVNDAGQMRVKVGPAMQGHHGQLLAMLAQASVKKEYPIQIEGERFTIADLIEMEKQTCYPRTELTFKLIGLMHYLDSDAQWLNDQGMEWDIPRLIHEEIRQPVRGAACGGTHRLTGLTLAYKTRIKRRQPVDGEYLRAKKFVQNYQRYAYRLQNSDGSFSTEWFRGRGDKEDVDRRLKTTGHILEWLLYAATDKELHHPQTTRAANYLADIMETNRYRDWEAGPLGHAVHALVLYDRKVYGNQEPWKSNLVAGKKSHLRK